MRRTAKSVVFAILRLALIAQNHITALSSDGAVFCIGAGAPKIASPGGKLSWNRLFGTDSMTEEECGRKSENQYSITDLFPGFTPRAGLFVSWHRRLPPEFLSRPLRGHPLPGRGNFTDASASERSPDGAVGEPVLLCGLGNCPGWSAGAVPPALQGIYRKIHKNFYSFPCICAIMNDNGSFCPFRDKTTKGVLIYGFI